MRPAACWRCWAAAHVDPLGGRFVPRCRSRAPLATTVACGTSDASAHRSVILWRQDVRVTATEARWYLLRLAVAHAAGLLLTLGLLVAALGATVVGLPVFAAGFALWIAAVVAAWVHAIRRSTGRGWFGPGSVTEEANELLGWGYLPAAAEVLGWSAAAIHRRCRLAVTVTGVAFLAASATVVLRAT